MGGIVGVQIEGVICGLDVSGIDMRGNFSLNKEQKVVVTEYQ